MQTPTSAELNYLYKLLDKKGYSHVENNSATGECTLFKEDKKPFTYAKVKSFNSFNDLISYLKNE